MASTSDKASAPPPKPNVVVPGTNNIIVHPSQRLNPVLENIRNVGKEFGEILVDYQVGRTTGVLFLSLKYHRLHPEYIHQRIERLGHSYNLRILLLMCDISEHQDPIRELTKSCLVNNITIIVTWSLDEAGHYLSTLKQFEHRPPDLIKERVDKDYSSILRASLTSISKVNKTDVETLRTSFGSFAKIAQAPSDKLQTLPGFGNVKVRRIKDAFEKPFRNNATSSLASYASSSQRRDPDQSQQQGPSTKGKEKEVAGDNAPPTRAVAREPSAAWDDFDLDLNPSPPQSADRAPFSPSRLGPAPDAPRPSTRGSPAVDEPLNDSALGTRNKRPASPVWDIELDLNDSDLEMEDEGPERKRPRNADFGQASLLK